MNENLVEKYWTKGPCPMKDQAEMTAKRYSDFVSESDACEDFYNAYKAGITGASLESPKFLSNVTGPKQSSYKRSYENFYGLGQDAADDIKRNTYDATYEIDDEYNIGFKNTNNPEEAKLVFLDKNNHQCAPAYYASSIAEHKPGVDLYLDLGAGIKVKGDSMTEVIRLAKTYAGMEDDFDYEDEAALVRQVQADYDAGKIDDDEYERRMDFLL